MNLFAKWWPFNVCLMVPEQYLQPTISFSPVSVLKANCGASSFKASVLSAKLFSKAQKSGRRRLFLSCYQGLLHAEASVIHRAALGWAGLHAQRGSQVYIVLHARCGFQPTGHLQQLIGSQAAPTQYGNCAACLALPLSTSAATSSHENILYKEDCFLVMKL